MRNTLNSLLENTYGRYLKNSYDEMRKNEYALCGMYGSKGCHFSYPSNKDYIKIISSPIIIIFTGIIIKNYTNRYLNSNENNNENNNDYLENFSLKGMVEFINITCIPASIIISLIFAKIIIKKSFSLVVLE